MKIAALFALLWLILGNPVAAIIIVLLLLYFLDRRFVGLTPSIARPLKRMRQLSQLRAQIGVNPHDHSAKMQLVRLLVEMKRYKSARELLLEMRTNMEHSAEFWSELGACELALGRPDEGERHMERALEINPRVKYGEPYLRLAETFASRDPAKALGYLHRFRDIHSSSCEALYRLGQLYLTLGQKKEAAQAFRECVDIYRALPRYMKRRERKWALLARFRA
ncbi:MAG: hypothetical protein BAA02_13350 [Paenibacillaceae bacterium ZCTH02-B3]|nr:MAG: hypothetical protein BAA02_13350 [Paenibacillaceae bacterium ZCTH02-B3]